MTSIEHIAGREVLDSRGNPTVEVEVSSSRAPGPGHRALRRLHRRSSRRSSCATAATATAARASPTPSANVDGEIATSSSASTRSTSGTSTAPLIDLDGTDDKSRLGANAILGVSLAVAHAAADELDLPLYRYVGGANAHVLPVPMLNVLNGGAHADNNVDFQEFMLMPVGAASFSEALRWGAETYHHSRSCCTSAGCRPAVGDEGGFAPEPRPPTRRRCSCSSRRSSAAGLHAGRRDRARPRRRRPPSSSTGRRATSWRARAARCAGGDGRLLADLCDRYPIVSIEDGMAEEDWDGWAELTDALGDRVQLVGDDLFVTNVERLARGIDAGVANSILVKVNQIGTLTETLDAVALATRSSTPRSCRTARARPRTPRSPTSRSPPTAARSSPARLLAPTASPSTTSCCASRTELGEAAEYLGGAALAPVRAGAWPR